VAAARLQLVSVNKLPKLINFLLSAYVILHYACLMAGTRESNHSGFAAARDDGDDGGDNQNSRV